MSDMKIVKVVVRGELPKRCLQCDVKVIGSISGGWKCGPTGKSIDDEISKPFRPTWCPLALEDEEA